MDRIDSLSLTADTDSMASRATRGDPSSGNGVTATTPPVEYEGIQTGDVSLIAGTIDSHQVPPDMG